LATLARQAAGGYVEYDTASGAYSLTPEQAVALTDEDSPFYVGGGFFVIKAMTAAVPRIEEYFRSGGGMRWGEHDPDLFIGTERHGKVFPARLLCASGRIMDSLTYRGARETKDRRQGRGCRLRSWRLNHHHGPGISEFAPLGF